MKTRDELINLLIGKCQANSYLEIGICNGANFQNVRCNKKTGVDPFSPSSSVSHRMTSDVFFANNKNNYDVIFVDGLHVYEQVYRDITNSLKFLNKNGFIICHDMNPPTKLHQQVPRPNGQRQWNGDCWKAWVRLRSERSDLSMCVVDIDWGCGVISFGKQQIINLPKNAGELDFNYLESNRNEVLNLVTVDEFLLN